MQTRLAVLIAAAAILVAGCTGSAAPPSTTEVATSVRPASTTSATTLPPTTVALPTATLSSEEAELAGDSALITALWDGWSEAWWESGGAGFLYVVAHNHPSLGCPLDPPWPYSIDFMIPHDGFSGFDLVRIARREHWQPPDGVPTDAGARFYLVDVDWSHRGERSVPGYWQLHVGVSDDQAWFLFPCPFKGDAI